MPQPLHPALEASFARWEHEGPTGDAAHRERLAHLADALRDRIKDRTGALSVLFVCTHNSRRSHMAQLLGLAAAKRNGFAQVQTFSGGTEVTAFNARAVAALQRAGFVIDGKHAEGPARTTANPVYEVALGPGVEPVQAFSKKLTDAPNPTHDFVVVMTCSQADAACPLVHGAAARVAIPYEDPKEADGTAEEEARYDERVAQIGRDMAWVFASLRAR
jgi:protein-tyrosine phosphatase/arsenate reductase